MPTERQKQVNGKKDAYFHCITRCVRRAFLNGYDEETGQDYDYRRQWIVDRFTFLSDVFSIEVCAYAVMSNHYHIVLHVNEQNLTWDAKEVVRRWWQVCPPKMLKESESDEEIIAFHMDRIAEDVEKVQLWRDRLSDLSWFMRHLNEPIARRANQEDNCTGRFWEERFKSQILLDKSALITCMAYVDLNPVRANMAETPETSDYTSIQQRIEIANPVQATENKAFNTNKPKTNKLMPFAQSYQETLTRQQQGNHLTCLPIEKEDYFKLVDWTGRKIKAGKRGVIPDDLAPILERLEINQDQWVDGVQHYGRRFYKMVGIVRNLLDQTVKQSGCWLKGQQAAKLLYSV